MESELFRLLDDDWATWHGTSAPETALRRWERSAPSLEGIASFEHLLDLFERRSPAAHGVRDGALFAIVRLAPRDPDAYRTLLHLLRPGLLHLSSRAGRWWGWEEASSAVMAAMVDRISCYRMHRTSRVAANLLCDVWHSVWALRQAELRLQSGIELVEMDTLNGLIADEEPCAAEEVLSLVGDAVTLGHISRRDGRLVALHRVFGFTNVEVAGMESCRPCTVRKRRVAAETAIAELAVA